MRWWSVPKNQKSTLLVKILPDNPKIKNVPLIHLWIYKKIFISGLSSAKYGFFTHKRTPSKINFVSKNFARHPKIEKLPLIHLRIYKSIFVLGSNSNILPNKVDFWESAYLVKNPHFCSVLAHILCVNYKISKTKIPRSASQKNGARSSNRPKRKSASQPCGSIWVAKKANFG